MHTNDDRHKYEKNLSVDEDGQLPEYFMPASASAGLRKNGLEQNGFLQNEIGLDGSKARSGWSEARSGWSETELAGPDRSGAIKPGNSHSEAARFPVNQPYTGGHFYLFSSACGGCGTSTTAALFAQYLSQMGQRVALVDLDFSRGGLDILLGLEEEEGLRWSDVHAPLGMIDGRSLAREAVQWEQCALLSVKATQPAAKQWWEVSAVLRSLGECMDAVVCDCGINQAIIRGFQLYINQGASLSSQAQDWSRIWNEVGNRNQMSFVILTELTMMALARTKVIVTRLGRSAFPLDFQVVSLEKAASSGGRLIWHCFHNSIKPPRGTVNLAEASNYLGITICGIVPKVKWLDISLGEGRGIEKIPRSCYHIFYNLSLSASPAYRSGGQQEEGMGSPSQGQSYRRQETGLIQGRA